MKYYWKAESNDGSYEDKSTRYFDTEEECYLDMRNAALEKMKWNTEWLDVKEGPGDYDSIGYEVHFAPKRIVHESYSGVYTYDMISGTTLSECVKEDLYMFYSRWREFVCGEENEAIFDTHDDLDLCLLAELYGAQRAVDCKKKARYWYGGLDIIEPMEVTDIAKDIDTLIDTERILDPETRWFWKEYVDLEKLENK